MSNGTNELIPRRYVTLAAAAKLLGVTEDELRERLARELTTGGELAGAVGLLRTVVVRLARPRPIRRRRKDPPPPGGPDR
jgi:hypothetical protein